MSINKNERSKLIATIKDLARKAGDELLKHYHDYLRDEGSLDIEIKDDDSPVTTADKAVHELITSALKKLTPNIPIISEENASHPEIPNDGVFWTVDPLDGTKGFINKTGGFYVKIALMENFKPVLGVIAHPVKGTLFYSVKGENAYMEDENGSAVILKTNKARERGDLTTAFNELHHNPQAYETAKNHLRAIGLNIADKSSAKGKVSTVFNMAVATGEAEAYLDCGGNDSLKDGNGFSWDYAADWLILKNAGGIMIEINTGKEPVFHRPTERMNAMVSLGDKALGERIFPKLKNDCV